MAIGDDVQRVVGELTKNPKRSIAIAVSAVAFFTIVTTLVRRAKAKGRSTRPPKVFGYPFLGSPAFFTRRFSFLKQNQKKYGDFFMFSLAGHECYFISGDAKAQLFFGTSEPYQRNLSLSKGYEILHGDVGVMKVLKQEEDVDEVPETMAHFSRRLGTLLRPDRMNRLLPELVGDMQQAMQQWGSSGTMNPFESFFDIVFQLTVRTVGCNEMAGDEVVRKNMETYFNGIEDGSSLISTMVPSLPSAKRRVKHDCSKKLMYLILQIIDAKIEKAEARKTAGEPASASMDGIDTLIAAGDSKYQILSFLVGAIFAGYLNTGMAAAWVVIFLQTQRQWVMRIMSEVEAAVRKHSNGSLPKTSDGSIDLSILPFEAWMKEIPSLDACVAETIRIQTQNLTALRRVVNEGVVIDGHELPVADIHMDESRYKDPTTFDPSRWEGANDEPVLNMKEPPTFLGWGGGRHPCLGMGFAKLELRIIVLMALMKYDFKVISADKDPRPNPDDFLRARPMKPVSLQYSKQPYNADPSWYVCYGCAVSELLSRRGVTRWLDDLTPSPCLESMSLIEPNVEGDAVAAAPVGPVGGAVLSPAPGIFSWTTKIQGQAARQFSAVQQSFKEKFGTAKDITELPLKYRELEEKVDKIKAMHETLIKVSANYTRPHYDYEPPFADSALDFATTITTKKVMYVPSNNAKDGAIKLPADGADQEPPKEEPITPSAVSSSSAMPRSLSHALAKAATVGAAGIPAEDPMGSALRKFSSAHERIGNARLKLDAEASTKFHTPYVNMLQIQIAQAMASKPEREEAARSEMEAAEDEFVAVVDDAMGKMATVIDNPQPLKCLADLVSAQLSYFKTACEVMAQVAPEIDELAVLQEHALQNPVISQNRAYSTPAKTGKPFGASGEASGATSKATAAPALSRLPPHPASIYSEFALGEIEARYYETSAKKTEAPTVVLPHTLDRLKYQAALQLSRAGRDTIALVCPHPGAVLYLEGMVKHVAHDLNADVLSLDFLTLVSLGAGAEGPKDLDSPTRSKKVDKNASTPFFPQVLTKVAPSFKPAQYATRLRGENGDVTPPEGDEFDEDEDHEHYYDPFTHDETTDHLPEKVSFKLSFPLPLQGAKQGYGRRRVVTKRASFEILGKASAFGGKSAESAIMKLDERETFYSTTTLSSTEAEKAMLTLTEFILEKAAAGGISASKRIILTYQDTTDTLEYGGAVGLELWNGLLATIEKLRVEHNLFVALVGICTPTMVHYRPHQTAFNYYNLFTQMIKDASGPKAAISAALSQKKFSVELWKHNEIFRSVLDLSKNVDKLEVLPPTTALLQVGMCPEGDLKCQDEKFLLAAEHYATFLKEMKADAAARLRQMKCVSVVRECLARGARTRCSEVEGLLKAREYDETQQLTTGAEDGIWTQATVKLIVTMALGFRFASLGGDNGNGTVELNERHFKEAFKMLNITEYRNGRREAEVMDKYEVFDDEEPTEDLPDSDPDIVPASSSSSAIRPGPSSPKKAEASTSNTPAVGPPDNTDGKESAETALKNLKKSLARTGKLTSYELKLLGSVVSPGNINVSFSDLVLPPSTKLMLQTLVSLPLLRPEHFTSGVLSKHSINGVLLFGPPGTGKTMLAKAVAKSSGAKFLNVALSDIFDKYVGEGEKNVKAVFQLARKLSPCVVFLDEVDALFAARSSESTSSRREIINEFMAEWDGVASANDGIIVMGATNRPFDLDDAILRRMPRRVLVDLPTEAQRLQILEAHLQDESLDSSVSLAAIAARTRLYSGSDLKNVSVAAALAAVKEAVVREHLANQGPEQQLTTEEVLAKAETIDQWSSFVEQPLKTASAMPADKPSKRTLNFTHFEVALKEVPPSVTEEMQTLVELRKWNDKFGEGSVGKSKKKGWGFDIGETPP
ncbi:hypothetical protein HK101_004764 [Irineochytrium annulatum]|nr:hypothetical protein HK101_004764 [Irineochytrium annulatum]